MDKETRLAVNKFLFAIPAFTREQYWESYRSWPKGGSGWNKMHQGGTGIMNALMWYQHVHKPGSKEWRPSIIIAAVVEAAEARAHEQVNKGNAAEGWK